MISRLSAPWTSLACAAAILLAMCVGCGHTPRSGMSRGHVTITATLGETPLDGAMIDLFCQENGEAYGGKLDASGTVRLTDVAIGQYAVTFLPPEGPPPLPGVPLEKQEQLPWKLPRKVRRPETTPLTAEVTEGSNEFTFDVNLEDVASQKK